jgi:hypothetical protein
VSADQRVQIAREYLTSTRQHKVSALPLTVLLRECAELRRQLGQVLDAIGEAPAGPSGVSRNGPATLTRAGLLTVLAALDEAARLRAGRAGAWCEECQAAPDECCPMHAEDLNQALAYRQLACNLRGQQ